MNYRRIDAWLIVTGLIVLVVQWATNAGWLVIPFALFVGASALMPASWTVSGIRRRSNTTPDDGGFL